MCHTVVWWIDVYYVWLLISVWSYVICCAHSTIIQSAYFAWTVYIYVTTQNIQLSTFTHIIINWSLPHKKLNKTSHWFKKHWIMQSLHRVRYVTDKTLTNVNVQQTNVAMTMFKFKINVADSQKINWICRPTNWKQFLRWKYNYRSDKLLWR